MGGAVSTPGRGTRRGGHVHELGGTGTPTGATHEVGVDQLFLSTTDARGVILEANSVFVELSRFPREQMLGVGRPTTSSGTRTCPAAPSGSCGTR